MSLVWSSDLLPRIANNRYRGVSLESRLLIAQRFTVLSLKMSKIERLNARVSRLLTTAVHEVLEVVKDTVSEYQEKTARTQRENERLQRRLQELQQKFDRECKSSLAEYTRQVTWKFYCHLHIVEWKKCSEMELCLLIRGVGQVPLWHLGYSLVAESMHLFTSC